MPFPGGPGGTSQNWYLPAPTPQSYDVEFSQPTLPTASATYRGVIIWVPGDGTTTADTAYMCLLSATGTYSWKQIVSG